MFIGLAETPNSERIKFRYYHNKHVHVSQRRQLQHSYPDVQVHQGRSHLLPEGQELLQVQTAAEDLRQGGLRQVEAVGAFRS